MFNLKVTKQDGSIEQSDFKTNQEAIDWKDHCITSGFWGKSAYDEVIPEYTQIDGTIVPVQTIHHKAEYSFEITEIKEAIEDISPRQIRMALLSLGLAENAIDGAISNLSSPSKEQAMIAWKYSTSFKRDAEAVSMIGALLSLSSEQLDQIWKVGSNL